MVLSACPSLGAALYILMEPSVLGLNLDAWLGYNVDLQAVGIGTMFVLISMIWCLRSAANAVLVSVLAEIHTGAAPGRLKAPAGLREAAVELHPTKND